jgi:hypothetical protein
MPTPSLILVPARFKTGKLYTPVATTSGGVVLGASGDFNVTRATTATRVNASGFIEVVASGIPRLDYPLGGGCPALLVEPSGSNLALRSQDFSATWSVAASATVTGITSPDGTPNATTFIADSNTDRIRQTITLTSGTTYTYSLFGKFGALSSGFTMNVFQENATTYGSGVCQAFNLNEGTLGASGTVGAGFTLQSVGMENYGNGWYRCRMTVLMGYTPATNPRVGFRIGTQISGGIPLSVVSGSVSAWGAQLETGSVATSYIPTTTASATRNAEVISLSGAVSGCIGQTEGTIYAEVDISAFVTGKRLVELSNGSAANRMVISVQGSLIQFLVQNASSTQATIDSATLSSGTFKVAAAYASNDFVFYVNGVKAGEDFIGTVPALNQINIGSTWNSILQFNDRLRTPVALYTTRLTNAQLQALTT